MGRPGAGRNINPGPDSETRRKRGGLAVELGDLRIDSGHLLFGSSRLAQTLLAHGLIDELWLKIYPITLGRGKKLFAEGTIPAAFTLMESKVSTKGVIIASYKHSGDVKTGPFES